MCEYQIQHGAVKHHSKQYLIENGLYQKQVSKLQIKKYIETGGVKIVPLNQKENRKNITDCELVKKSLENNTDIENVTNSQDASTKSDCDKDLKLEENTPINEDDKS